MITFHASNVDDSRSSIGGLATHYRSARATIAMVAPVSPILLSRKRSLADMQHTDGTLPTEYNDRDYALEVLQLEDAQTERAVDQHLTKEAEKLGITISRRPSSNGNPHISVSESVMTVGSRHARTGSTGSEGSNSTGMTSRSSHDDHSTLDAQKPSGSRRSASFSEYERYLVQTEAQDAAKSGFKVPPIPSEPTPSLFSVSTRRSYVSIKNGIKSRFRLRKHRTSLDEDLK